MKVDGMVAVVENGARAVPDCEKVPITPEDACESVRVVPTMFETVVSAGIPSPSTFAYCATPALELKDTDVDPDTAEPICTSDEMALTTEPAATPVPETTCPASTYLAEVSVSTASPLPALPV